MGCDFASLSTLLMAHRPLRLSFFLPSVLTLRCIELLLAFSGSGTLMAHVLRRLRIFKRVRLAIFSVFGVLFVLEFLESFSDCVSFCRTV